MDKYLVDCRCSESSPTIQAINHLHQIFSTPAAPPQSSIQYRTSAAGSTTTMAETLAAPAKLESQIKHVQELAMDCHQVPPERYIYKESEYGGIGASTPPMANIPVIDISLLTNSTLQGREFKKLRSALSLWGCFQAVNHGIENSFLDTVRESMKQFFALPMEEKKKYSRAVDDVEGYGNDMVLSDNQTLDWTDRLYLHVSPKDKQIMKYWPEKPDNFRVTVQEYTSRLRLLAENLLKALARSLDLEENCFLNQHGNRPTMEARFNFYPPCQWPEKILGVKPHADGSAITILLQDKEVEGLQILKDDQWFRVPVIPHALFVNIGDQVEIMSNGIFKSPVHRVSTNSEKERMTLAMFCMPDLEEEVGPAKELITNERPRLYKKVKYTLDFFFQNYQQGRRPIDAAKI